MTANARDDTSIAVVGMSGRFPGAADIHELWALLSEGRHAFTEVSAQALHEAGVSEALLADPSYVKVSAALRDVEMFDADFFSYSAQQALELDPQHRLFLECAWHALEDAGCNPAGFAGAIGVFAGAGFSRYGLMQALSAAGAGTFLKEYARVLATDKDFLTTRVSYKLGLRGPSVAVQTGCSTSLVAVHLACQSLLSGQCDLALAGGVSLQIPQGVGYLWNEGGITAPDGRCRAFDTAARGTVPGSGVGIVALTRLADALARRDHIYAIIRGSAVNNDGSDKVSYTAPSVSGQAQVIAQAVAQSGIDPRTIGFIEAHGTGTLLGDAVELTALTRVFAEHSVARASCALGALKTNIGHLDTAAGVAGLIKTALCLQRRTRVATLNFAAPNQAFGAASPFHVETSCTPWPAAGFPRRAAVSSFGIGGTNAHAVLEEAPEVAGCQDEGSACVFPLSARTPAALQRVKSDLLRYLQQHEQLPLPDIARTLQVGRKAFGVRDSAVACSRAELLAALEQPASSQPLDASVTPRAVFLFPNDNASSLSIVRSLLGSRANVADHIARTLVCVPHEHRAAVATLLASAREDTVDGPSGRAARFLATYVLASTLMDWGIKPASALGWGAGYYVAACLSGVMRLQDALTELCDHGSAVLDSNSTDALAHKGLVHVTFGSDASPSSRTEDQPGVVLDAAASVPAVLLRQLAQLWQLGLAVDWTNACANSDRSKVALPGYPFERQRYWLQAALGTTAPAPDPAPDSTRAPSDDWFWLPAWEPAPAYTSSITSVAAARREPWLVFDNTAEPSAATLVARLRAHGTVCAWLTAGERFEVRANLDGVVSLREESHMAAALEALRSEGVKPRYFVCCVGASASAFGVLALLRSFATLYPQDAIDVIVVTAAAAGMTTDANIDPHGAMLHGLLAVLAAEMPTATCTVIDFPPRDSDDFRSHQETYLDWVMLEAAAARAGTFVAYRQRRRLTRTFTRVSLDAADETRQLRDGGVYLITGGLGRIGLSIARSLAEKCRARLLLTCRAGVPDHVASEPGASIDLQALAQARPDVAALASTGSELMIVRADTADPIQMRQAIAAAEARWGKINGVLHLAANLSDRSAECSLRELSRQDFQAQAHPKALGFQVLDSLLAERDLDFAIAFSSNATILGGNGLAAYAAANAFLNVAPLARDTRLPWMTLSWDGWGRRNDAAAQDSSSASISAAEGIEAFWRVFARGRSPWIVVSARDMPQRLAAARSVVKPVAVSVPPITAVRVPRPESSAPAVAPRTALEKRIVAIWEEALGVEGVGIEDDLFELNGDSMTAMNILARIREEFLVEVPLRRFLSSQSTIRRLSQEIAVQLVRQERSAELARPG